MTAKKSKKPQGWQETATQLLESYLKKSKSTSGSLLVLSVYGDVILKTSKAASVDATTLGSLAASVAAAGEGLGELLKLSGSPVQFGEGKNIFWFEKITDRWMLVGVRCGLLGKATKALAAHLKKVLVASQKSGAEALDGMSAGGLESSLNERMGGGAR